MNPRISERKSRRSSILKPPKPRQPLQNVELNISSTENSPTSATTKVRRRVSFAEKKHVKEFCDSIDQGTVWDNTYEESELSQMKNNQNSNNDENIISEENLQLKVHTEIDTQLIDDSEMNDPNLTREKSRISISMESVVSITDSINTEKTKVYIDDRSVERNFNCGDTMGGLVHLKSSGIPFPTNYSGLCNARRSLSIAEGVFRKSTNKGKSVLLESTGSCPAKATTTTIATGFQNSMNFVSLPLLSDDCNEVPMDETLIGNVSVESTTPTLLTVLKDHTFLGASFNIPNTDFLETDPNSSYLPFSKVSTTSKENIKAVGMDNPKDAESLAVYPKDQDRIIVYHDTSLDMTDAVSKKLSVISNHHETNKLGNKESFLLTKQKTTFQMKTMEIVTKISDLSSTGFKELCPNEIDLRPERTPIFHNKSMEFDNVLQNISSTHQFQKLLPEKTMISRNEPVNLTENVQNILGIENQIPRQRATIFHDKSLELTESVQNVPSIDNVLKLPQERTTIFHDKSFELTEAVQNVPSIDHLQKLPPERTTIFHDISLELTEAVQNDRNIDHLQKLPLESTTIFHDKSLELTEAVQNNRNIDQLQKPPPERTTIFHDKSLELTEAVKNGRNIDQLHKLPLERTTVFHDKSLELTEAVQNNRNIDQLQKPPPERTATFHDKSLESTEAVKNGQNIDQLHKLPLERTTMFHDKSLELTEAVQNNRNIDQLQKPPPERTTIFHDKSLELTEAVKNSRNIDQLHKLPLERTTVFHDKSLELTEAVQNNRNIDQLQKPPPERTAIFHDKSLELTEAVKNGQNIDQLHKLPLERTTMFHDKSLELTEAVQNNRNIDQLQKPPPERTTIFHDKSLELTETVKNGRNIDQLHKLPLERTTMFHDESVDCTEVVQNVPSIETPKLMSHERTTLFYNESLDFTEVVRSTPTYGNPHEPPSEKSTLFFNQSMDMSEVVRSSLSVESQQTTPLEKTRQSTIFYNQSMDMTNVIRKSSSHEKPQKPFPEKTTILNNQSVDTTKVTQSSPSYEIPQKPSQEKMVIIQNQAVDMSLVVRSNQAIDKSVMPRPESTTILHNKSMDAIKMIPSSLRSIQNPIEQVLEHEVLHSRQQRTSVSHNTSVALTNVEIGKGNEQSENQSLELTEAVSRVPRVSKLLSRDSCTLAMERMAKHKPLNLEEANRLIASIEIKNLDPEVRSPVSKRLKSLGSRKSIDVTAAVPFVMYRKLARQQCDEIKSTNCKSPSVEDNPGTSSKIEISGSKSMDITEVAVNSSNVDPPRTFPVRSGEIVPQETREQPTNFENKTMEMTEAMPYLYPFELTSQKFLGSIGDDGRQPPQNNDVFHDDSMEMTRAIPGILTTNDIILNDESIELTKSESHLPFAPIFPDTNENLSSSVNRRCNASPTCETETVFFRDELMELTNGVQLSKQPIDGSRIVVNLSSKDGKTMVYRDDSMELTRAVPFPSQTQTSALDKENCPLGMDHIQSRSSRTSGKKGTTGVSENEWLEIMNSVRFESSQNKENRAEPMESKEQIDDSGSDEITGVVPFAMQLEDNNGNGPDLERVKNGKPMGFETEKMEMTEGVRWSSGLNVETCENVHDDMGRQSQLPEKFPPVEKIQRCQSHVVKELFQKPVPCERGKTVNENPTGSSETADLDEEIRKLAKSFDLANSVNESGFDQATFLRQQARCMEDYEANSTAGQEYHAGALFTRENVPFMGNKDFPDPGRSNNWKDSTVNEEPALPTSNSVMSSNSKMANTSVCNKNNSIAENHCSSRIDRGHYDRSLEELRYRAYSVSKFRPEVTGFELTAVNTIADLGNPHETIFDQEPPSFVFVDSITAGSDAECAASVNEFPTESNSIIHGEKIQAQKSLETSHELVHDCTKTKSKALNITDIAEVTMTLEADAKKGATDSKDKKTVELPERKTRSQTFVIKRHNSNVTIPIISSPETDSDMKNERLSGATTAAEFSSESPDGPNEKIRRRENGLTTEENTLLTADRENNATELIKIGRSWENSKFTNSTVIGDDFTPQFVHHDVKEPTIVLKSSSSDALPSEIVPHGDQKVIQWPEVREANKITMRPETSVSKSSFVSLKETVEGLAKRAGTIWSIIRLDERIIAFNFFSKSIVLAIHLNDNASSMVPIKLIGFLSQLVEEGTDSGVCLAHRLIMEKVNSANLTHSYQTYEDIPRLLEYVTSEVKLGMDFMVELDRLRSRTIMDIHENRITFMVRTRDINAGIILNITIEVKPFKDITPNDITVAYLLGDEKVKENEIKRLITNVKRDHRFLRFYINDIRDYIDLIAEQTEFSTTIGSEEN